MKKIMKKALSLALALVMMVSLAPMTAWASNSMTGTELDVEGGTNTVLFDGDEKYVYTWTPVSDGAYTFTFYETDWVCSILGVTSGEYGSYNNNTGVFTHEFYAGVEYQIEILNTTWTADDINFTVVPGAAAAGPTVAGSTFNTAADVTEGLAGTIPATGMTSKGYFYIAGLDVDKNYTLTVMVNDPMAGRAQLGLTAYDLFGEAVGETTYSQGMVSIEVTPNRTPMNGGMVFFEVSHTAFNDLAVDIMIEAIGGGSSAPTGPVAGGASFDDAANVTDALAGSVAATGLESTGYFFVTGLESQKQYTLTAMVNDPMAGRAQIGLTPYYPNGEVAGDTVYSQGMVSVDVTAVGNNGGMVFFAVSHTAFNDMVFDFVLEPISDGEDTPGDEPSVDENANSYANPEVITGTGEFTLEGTEDASYWLQWNASAAGVFTVTTTTEGGMLGVDSVSGSYDYLYTGNDTTTSVQVVEGDEVLFYVYPGNGAITIEFEKDATLSPEGEGDGEGEVDVNYVEDGTALTEGANALLVSDYPYTVYYFAPSTPGSYTFTSNDSVMGIVGYFWVNEDQVNADVVKEDTFKWNCTDVGQGIYVAVQADTNVANINIEYAELNQTKIPEYVYSVSAEQYVFTGNVSDLTYVAIEDTKEDKAVLGKDGYYHLNSENGPILLVSLMDDVLSLGNATSTGKIAIAMYDNDGKVVGIKNYNDVLNTYVANSDKATGLYPLTEKLMEIYQVYGAQQSWYTESGFVGGQLELGNAADAWMFACMYIPNAEDGTIVVPPVVVAPEQVTDKVVDKETLTDIIEEAVKNDRPVVVPTTDEKVTMTFEAADLENFKEVDLNIEVTTITDATDESVAGNANIPADKFVLKVEFAHTGNLPAKATILIAVPAEIAAEYEVLYYYEIKADGKLEFVCEAPIDENGNAKVTQDHCSDYVLLTEKIVEEVEAPKTGDTTNFALWIAVLGLGVVAIAGSVVMKKREF